MPSEKKTLNLKCLQRLNDFQIKVSSPKDKLVAKIFSQLFNLKISKKMTIGEIKKLYSLKLDYIDVELLLMNSLNKTREFVLTYPEFELNEFQIKNFKLKISRRMRGEPIAYITGHKEFYGLDFEVNKHTLVPRPETELMVEQVLHETYGIKHETNTVCVIDVGTGSGCIIISVANSSEKDTSYKIPDTRYYAIDISKEALKIAKKNAKTHELTDKIKFLHGNLLEPILKCSMIHASCSMIITANLPYLSKDIYNSAPIDVKKFEPKSALYSPEQGLQHYRKLLKQIKEILDSCSMFHVSCFFEISPEQKRSLTKIIKSVFSEADTSFTKDLAGKWRICKIVIKK